MEGLLWKWTNYWSGWQPRWFILDDGILSYYNSQDEVGKGCKGSIKMAVCDVIVDHADNNRLELNIASEQHFYLKAANSKERQQWLVALGSCKATLQTLSDPTNYISEKEHKVLHSGVKQKKSELRIYCDLLMQQVHAIKEANKAEPPDPEKVEQCSVLLSETCDTFIHTLEDCMKLVDNPTQRSRHSSNREVTKPSSPVIPGMKHTYPGPHSPSHDRNPPRSILRKTRRSLSQSSTGTDTDVESPTVHHKPISPSRVDTAANHTNNHTTSKTVPHSSSSEPEDHDQSEPAFSDALPSVTPNTTSPSSHGDNNNRSSRQLSKISENGSAALPKTANFFNSLGSSFVSMRGMCDDGVNTKNFTACAAELAKIFDKLSATAFSPVKNDLLGNCRKIEQKWTTDPKNLSTLQKLIDFEIRNKQHLDPNSATQALLWLTRGLMFVTHILVELPKQDTLLMAVSIAYDRTLKPFHNFVVKGVVSIGMRALPYKKDFIASFCEDADSDGTDEQYVSSTLRDAELYQEAVISVCTPVIEFYRERNMIIIQDQTSSETNS